MYKSLCMFVIMFAMMAFPVYASNANPEGVRFVVMDSCKEKYGNELKNEITAKLEKQLPGGEMISKDLRENTLEKLQLGDQKDLNSLAKELGSKYVLTVEILPVKSDYSDLLYYKNIKTVATLRIRLYNTITQKYALSEDVIGRGSNTTWLPYTSIGKKPPVKEAVRKATEDGIKKINQSIADSSVPPKDEGDPKVYLKI
ncbi:hypothetical protein [Pelosinus propionicus]|uniref:Uncharacterized protein n=1 Tax=Pelosinus propionicus DSM 13327 TaxID=1123291 RepID=A0A1I4PIK8_9FIRM|nr:hypothetical protein [Pelosinus propionicus]SFM27386.1 hypothetical protein SAMN04490355_106414 [Pelosinus propionicus DSM 13327]